MSDKVSKRAVVLLSGGLDSATTLYIARKQGNECYCLAFDYGQRHIREIQSAKKIAKKAGCPLEIIKIALPWKGSSLLDKRVQIQKGTRAPGQSFASLRIPFGSQDTSRVPNTYVPARNIIFLSFALSFAETIKAQAIFIGAHSQDYSGYPDCRPEFYQAFGKVVAVGTKAGIEKKYIKIKTPLISMGKAEIIKLGSRLGVPFALTWSCYRGGSLPCGSCDSCYYRAIGFKEAKIVDPILKVRIC